MTTILNDWNERTKGVIHIMVTSLCKRNCKYCCNKVYELNSIPYVNDFELSHAHTICLTGGEPFAFTDPCEIAQYYKQKYPNIKNVYVYTNAVELGEWILQGRSIKYIDGVNVSIKNGADASMFENVILPDARIQDLSSNLLYIFHNLYTGSAEGFSVFHREWQTEFQPATNSIFRKA